MCHTSKRIDHASQPLSRHFGEMGCSYGSPYHLSGLVGLLMFPDPNDDPADGTQVGTDLSITLLVAGDLRTPPVRVSLRPRHVIGAPVPEASIDKNRDPLARKEDIDAGTT